MKQPLNLFIIGAALAISGCGPTIVHIEDDETIAPTEAAVESPQIEAVAIRPVDDLTTVNSEIAATKDYIVLNEPWNTYFRSEPTILVLPKLSQGISNILNEEQLLIKSVLDSGGKANANSEYIALGDKLEELKTIIPQAETGSGYVPSRSRRYGTYTSSGGSVYINSRYYYGYYTVLRSKTMSSSPEMTRSVEGIAHNATLEDLDHRIDALQQIQRSWNRRTAEMSTSGTSGIMRSANLAYLDGLRGYAQEFTSIRKELRAIERKQEAVQRNRVNILADWEAFEAKRLNILEDYFNSNAIDKISPSEESIYKLPSFKDHKLLYACEIGERTLYFDITDKQSDQHPFVLIDIAPKKQVNADLNLVK
ncbi:MAG: hypothetical protein ACN4GF_00615 [Lentimonas sp.]